MPSRELDGWSSTDRRGRDGAIESTQRFVATRPLVAPSEEGARRLGRGYWSEVRAASRGLVRFRERGGRVELRLLGLAPALLRFERARVVVEGDDVSCSYLIAGGVLARRAGGTLSLAQTGGARPELRIAVSDFHPRLDALYERLERRVHESISRRYFARLVAEGLR